MQSVLETQAYRDTRPVGRFTMEPDLRALISAARGSATWKKGRVGIFFAAGIGNPFFKTDLQGRRPLRANRGECDGPLAFPRGNARVDGVLPTGRSGKARQALRGERLPL